MSAIINVTEESLEQDVYNADQVVLLDLWAPWCAPCRGLAPVLEKLSLLAGGNLTIAKMDVEKYPDAMSRFNVRGIPSLILFRDGKEIGRELGVKTLTQLKDWVSNENVTLGEAPAPLVEDATYGAFYGDSGLKHYLDTRLLTHAREGAVQVARAPYWQDGAGTASAAWVHSGDPAIFERITGLSSSFAMALDFVAPRSEEVLTPILGALRAGSNMNLIPLQLIRELLSSVSLDWPGLLAESKAMDTVRVDWIKQCDAYLKGADPEKAGFNNLAVLAKPHHDHQDRAVGNLAKVIEALSPPPAARDTEAWSSIFGISTTLCFAISQNLRGWSLEDRQTEERRHFWFTERLEQTADGEFSDEELQTYQRQWLSENEAYQLKEAEFFDNGVQGLKPIQLHLQQHLIQLTHNAPAVAAA